MPSSSPRREPITIDVRLQTSVDGGERIRFSVTDTGIGVPADRQHRLFKKFSQVDSSMSRRHGGTGLACDLQATGRTDGRPDRNSQRGRSGATVWFTAALPVVDPPALPQTGSEAPVEFVAGKKFRILVVDDIETNREIVEAYLRDDDYDVTTVASAVEAIRLIQPSATTSS